MRRPQRAAGWDVTVVEHFEDLTADAAHQPWPRFAGAALGPSGWFVD